MEARQGFGRRRWNRAAVFAALIGCALLFAPARAGADPMLDANCPGPADGSFLSFGDRREAQTFTALQNGGLTSATIAIQKPALGAGRDFVVQILPTADGVPIDVPLASVTIPGESVPPGQTAIHAIFPSPSTAVAGQVYALAIGRPGNSTSFSVRTRSGDPCGGGPFFNTGPDQVWAPRPQPVDFVFQTFVDPQVIGAQGPAPGQLAPGAGLPSNDFTLLNRRGQLFARVPGPGKLVLDDAKKPKPSGATAARKRKRDRGFVKRTKAKAKKAGLVKLRFELTKRAISRILATRKLNAFGGVTYTPTGGTPRTLVFKIRIRV